MNVCLFALWKIFLLFCRCPIFVYLLLSFFTVADQQLQQHKQSSLLSQDLHIGQLHHMRIICISLQRDNHTSTSPLSFLQARCPSCRPNNRVKVNQIQGISRLVCEIVHCRKFGLTFTGCQDLRSTGLWWILDQIFYSGHLAYFLSECNVTGMAKRYIARSCTRKATNHFWATVYKTVCSMLSIRCLSCPVLSCVTLVYCDRTVWWSKMKLRMQVGLGPGHIVLDG